MTVHEAVRKATNEQRNDITAIMIEAIPTDLTFDEAQAIIDSKPPFVAEIGKAFNRRKVQPFIRSICVVTIPASSEPFVAREKFTGYTSGAMGGWTGKNQKVKMSSHDLSFERYFLEKTEEPGAETKLRCARLTRPSGDDVILQELGDAAEVKLSQVFSLIARQPNGKKGALLTSGSRNIFYARDVHGNLRPVCVFWNVLGWSVDVGSDGRPEYGGSKVFYQDSKEPEL